MVSFMANDTAAVKRAAAKKTAPKKAAVKKSAKPAPPSPPAGWYLDPADQSVERYWDGDGWDTSRGSRPPGGADPAPDGGAEEAAASTTGTDTITFRGRVMAYRRPSADQLAVWKMIAERAAGLAKEVATPKPCPTCKGEGCDTCQGTGSAHSTTIFKLFNRAMTIINSVLVDEGDKDWLEDEMIAGRVDMEAAAQIISLTVDALIASKPETAPRNGPAPKARRRR